MSRAESILQSFKFVLCLDESRPQLTAVHLFHDKGGKPHLVLTNGHYMVWRDCVGTDFSKMPEFTYFENFLVKGMKLSDQTFYTDGNLEVRNLKTDASTFYKLKQHENSSSLKRLFLDYKDRAVHMDEDRCFSVGMNAEYLYKIAKFSEDRVKAVKVESYVNSSLDSLRISAANSEQTVLGVLMTVRVG